MKRALVAVFLTVTVFVSIFALDILNIGYTILGGRSLANSNYFDLSTGNFSQDWSNTGLITANDNWSGVPSVEGFLGQDLTTATGTDPQTLLGTSALPNDLDVIANQINPNTVAAGGVGEFDAIPNPTIALNGSGTADAPYVIFYLNTTGRQNVQVSYNLRDLDGSADNSIQPVALQYRVGTTGNFTNVPAGFVADATTGPSIATLVTPVSVMLPSEVNNQAQVQVRVMTANAVGNDEWVGVDDIVVSSSPTGGNPGSIQFSATGYNPFEGDGFITATVKRVGGTSGSVGVTYSTSNGTATSSGASCSGGNDYGTASGTVSWADGDASDKFVNITVCDDSLFEGDENFNISLSNPTGGASIGSPSSALITILDDDPEPATIQFATTAYVDDESQSMIVSVLRQGDLAGPVSVSIVASTGTATGSLVCSFGADFAFASQELIIGDGDGQIDVQVPLCADSFTEGSEQFTLTLSDPSGAVLGTNTQAIGTIIDTASKYRNTDAISINDGTTANLFPSEIAVAGEAGPVGSLRVTLYDVQHINFADVDILLVGPGGQNLILSSDGGGAVSNAQTLTFVDSAGQVIPQAASPVTGDYEPTSWTSGQPDFASPAPAGPYNEPGSGIGGGPNLTSVFGGTDPNGTWKLFIRDDNGALAPGGLPNGRVLGGWGLEIFTQPGGEVTLSGMVATFNERAVRGSLIRISGGDLAAPRYAQTNTFGRFRFAGLTAGQTYDVVFSDRRYILSPASASFTLNSSISDAFVLAIPPN